MSPLSSSSVTGGDKYRTSFVLVLVLVQVNSSLMVTDEDDGSNSSSSVFSGCRRRSLG